MSELITVSRKSSITTVIINNPKRRNALNREAWVDLTKVMTEISNDASLRCVILRGAGDKAFAAGADIAEFPINRIGHPFAYPELAPVLQVAGRAAVLELVIEGRIVDSDWAASRGLVNRVVPDDKLEEEIAKTAANIADAAPLSIRGTKKFVNRLMLDSTA